MTRKRKTPAKKKTAKPVRGRPVLMKNPTEEFSLTLKLGEGCMAKLQKKYDCNKKATVVRKAIHELLGFNEKINESVDSNVTRQKKKEVV